MNTEVSLSVASFSKIVKTCSAGNLLGEASRRDANEALERFGEMSLIVKANLQADIR